MPLIKQAPAGKAFFAVEASTWQPGEPCHDGPHSPLYMVDVFPLRFAEVRPVGHFLGYNQRRG
jgi:hypothetical protein